MHIYSIFYPHIRFFSTRFYPFYSIHFLEFLKCHQLYKRTLIYFMHPFSQWWNLMKIFLLQVSLIFCIFLPQNFFHCLILIKWMASENKACEKKSFQVIVSMRTKIHSKKVYSVHLRIVYRHQKQQVQQRIWQMSIITSVIHQNGSSLHVKMRKRLLQRTSNT